MKKEIIFINSHPIQYFAPLYKYLNENGVSTTAWYCTDKTIKGGLDKEFGVQVKWDIPLLDGYKYKFFKNQSPKPSHENGYFGLMNFGLIAHLFKIPKSIIIVHGWHYFTHSLVLLLARLKGHTVCLRYEMPYNQEQLKVGFKQDLKRTFLKRILFSQVSRFLYIGTQNKRLYQKTYSVPNGQLVFCPYSVDNARFTNDYTNLKHSQNNTRASYNIGNNAHVILYSGKYIDKKRPLDVLKAFNILGIPDCWLIMLGEGELRSEMEQYIRENKMTNVILTGFVNQSQVASFYSISDVFVMCSTVGETWGLSANEALNFHLPLVISDHTGSSSDLVVEGVNGYVFKTGDVEDLAAKLSRVIINKENFKLGWSEELLAKYSYASIRDNLKKLVDQKT